MLRRPSLLSTALTTLFLVAACAESEKPGDDSPDSGGSNASGSGGSGTSGAGSSNAGTGPAGSGGKNVSGASGSNTAGAGSSSGGAGTTAGSSGASTSGSGNVGGSTSGSGNVGGSTSGSGNVGGSTSGSGNVGGSASGSGGATGGGGSGPDVDQNGKMNATPGTTTSTPQDYLRLGEVRILNNNWGSEELGCNANMSVFIQQDRKFGWSFNRGDCDTQGLASNPDFPQIEFGIHPFGIGDPRVTSPEFSSTSLLPIQLKNVQSASVIVQNMTANFQQETSWNITFEFWISERNPLEPNPGVYAELMTFWGWQNGRWPSPPNGMGPTGNGAGNQVQSGGKSYTLWVQDDQWADGQWRYFQFRVDDGPQRSFNGTLDVKPFIDYLVNSRQYSPDFWISRLEIGSEIDDNTQGTVVMDGITFEVNGQTRPAIIGGN
jgi:hypothetical protein